MNPYPHLFFVLKEDGKPSSPPSHHYYHMLLLNRPHYLCSLEN
ncbi:hypothetical protein LINPERHAP1_LOCUS39867 [Linum perenne]